MTDVVIVEAVRTPIGRRNGGLATVHPADLLGTVLTELIARSGHRPGRGRPGRRRLRQPGRRAVVQHRPHGVAQRRPPARHRRHHRRHPVRLVAAGHQPGHQPGGVRRGRRRHRLRRRADVAGADRVELVQEAGPRRADPQDLLRPLRVHLAVRGRRAHRRQVGRHPRRHRRLRAAVAAAGGHGLGRGPLRRPGRRASTPPTSTTRASPTGTTHRVARDEGLRETSLEALGQPQAGGPARRRAHRRQLVADQRRRRRPCS